MIHEIIKCVFFAVRFMHKKYSMKNNWDIYISYGIIKYKNATASYLLEEE